MVSDDNDNGNDNEAVEFRRRDDEVQNLNDGNKVSKFG